MAIAFASIYSTGVQIAACCLWDISLLCGPISPVMNIEMSSTARFFCGNAINGCSGLVNCRMLNFLSIAFFLIGLISLLIS